jgi:multidrug transporter EmrE-like cation transporter
LAGGISGSMILVVAPRLQAVFIFSTSTVILRSRVLPSWLAIVGYVSGLMLFVVPLVTQPVGLAFPVWVFIVSVVMMLKRP